MWYDSSMPEHLPAKAIKAAYAAADNAKRVREYHARRSPRGSKQRQDDIKIALAKLKDAMKPLRTEIGRFPYGPQTTAAEANREQIRQASDAIQRERRKLWKMGGTRG